MMSNEEVLEKYEEDCLLRGLSERTIASYRRIFDVFLEFSGEAYYASLGEAHLRCWLLHLRREGRLAGATENQYNSACRFLLSVVLKKDINKSQVPNCRIKRMPKPAMTADEVREFFSHFDDITSFTYFMLLYSTGIRRSEALEVAIGDILRGRDGESSYLIIRSGKGGHSRYVELPHATYMLLREYYRKKIAIDITGLSEEEKEGIKAMPLFPASINGVKANNFFTNAFNAVKKSSIKFKSFHPHILRHTFAVHMLQKDTGSILRVKANLGHRSLATTEIYLEDSKLFGIKDPKSPAELAEELCSQFYARTGI